MKQLKIYPSGTLSEINQDMPSLLECIADGLSELGFMSHGRFNLPNWMNDSDIGRKKAACDTISGVIENLKFLARINGISTKDLMN